MLRTTSENERLFLEGIQKTASFGNTSDHAEQTLMEMAYAVLVDRVRPLMRDPFRLGFEVVHSNEDSSQMVGIFVFRVGKNLFYIPTFYRNGQVKGMHTIYECNRKKIKPLTKDWAERLVAVSTRQCGKGVEKGIRATYGSSGDLGGLTGSDSPSAFRGGTIKVASINKVLEGEELDGSLFTLPEFHYEPGALLKKALEVSGPDSVKALATACRDETFLDGLMSVVGDPAEFIRGLQFPLKKEAMAFKEENSFELIPVGHPDFAKHASELSEEELSKATSRGFLAIDNRPLEKKGSIEVMEDCESISDSGFYRVKCDDGKTRRLAAFRYIDTELNSAESEDYGYPPVGTNCYPREKPSFEDLVYFDADSGECSTHQRFQGDEVLFGSQDGRITAEGLPSRFKKEPSEGSAYAMVQIDSGILVGYVYVASKKQAEGNENLYRISGRIRCSKNPIDTVRKGYDTGHVLQFNPSASASKFSKGLIGGDVRFFELKNDTSEENVNNQEIDMPMRADDEENEVLFASKCIPASPINPFDLEASFFREADGRAAYYIARSDPATQSWEVRYQDGEFVEFDSGMPKSASEEKEVFLHKGALKKIAHCRNAEEAAIHIVRHSGLSLEDAEKITARPGKKFLVKRASLTEQPPLPDWVTGYNADHATPMEEVEKYVIQVNPPEYVPEDILDSNLGDREGRSDPNPNLFTATPTELFQFSRNNEVKALFEHGAVKELIRTYDVGMLIDNYLPEMETALDRLGRILILINWKPSEVAEIYGVEDTVLLEDNILSGFLNLGEIVLDLDTRLRDREVG